MTSPIHVFLDTSALPRSPTYLGLGFESLCQLAQSGLAKVYLSSIVESEWRSQLERDWTEQVLQAQRAVKKLLRHPWSAKIDGESALTKALSALSRPSYRIGLISQSSFDDLVARLEPEILDIAPDHAPNVFDSYFHGYGPFTSPKNREGIPDAFIHQSALDLAERVQGELHCVIADSALRESLSAPDEISTYETLGDFVSTERVRALTRTLAPAQLWAATLSTLSKRLPKAATTLSAQLEEALSEELLWFVIKHMDIPEDNQEAMITMVYEPENLAFEWESAVDFGPGLLAIPFEALLPVTISFMVYRGDAYGVPEGVFVDYGDPASDHYFDAEGNIEIEVKGLAASVFDLETINEDDLPKLKQVGVHKLDRIEPIEQMPGAIFLTTQEEFE